MFHSKWKHDTPCGVLHCTEMYRFFFFFFLHLNGIAIGRLMLVPTGGSDATKKNGPGEQFIPGG